MGIVIGIAIAAALVIASSRAKASPPAPATTTEVVTVPGAPLPDSVSTAPFGDLPPGLQGRPEPFEEQAPSGSVYQVDQYPPDALDRVFIVAQLRTPGFPANVVPYSSWISFHHDRQTGTRQLWRAHAANDDSGAIVQTMLRDFNVPVA